jgi:Ca2+-binding EF-hand superfamily protein
MPKRCKDLVYLAFQQIDRDGSGIIDLNDLVGVYDTSHHPDLISGKKTEGEILTELLEAFDVGGEVDGKVSHEEFQNYYDYLYINIPSDDYFELMIRNAWHLSGGEGVCAGSANKRVLVTNSDGTQSVVEIKDDLGLKANDKQGMVARLRAQGVTAASIELSSGAVDQDTNTPPPGGKVQKPPPFRGLSKGFTGSSSTKDEYATAIGKTFTNPNEGSLGRPGSSGFQNLSSSVNRSMRSQRKVRMNVPPPSVDATAAINSSHPMLVKLKEILASRGARGIAGLSRAFKRMDNNGNKSLDFSEFSQALSEMGLTLLEPEKRQLFIFFDKDRSGSVSYDELLVSLRVSD